MADDPVAARVYRGEVVESAHRGHLAVVDGRGRAFARFGDPGLVAFTRSALKPWQLLPLVASGAADRYGFTEGEIALMASSHSGEPHHVKAVQGILERAGLEAGSLRCGAHLPYHAPSAAALADPPTALHHNCSGKHAGMLALAKFLGAPLDSYLDAAHPVQVRVRDAVARWAEVPAAELRSGVDGCSAPNYALPVEKGALLAARLARPPAAFGEEAESLARIARAMVRHPHDVAGTGRFDTTLMETADGRLISKAGGEAVQLVADLETGLGLFLKVEDGNGRAVPPIAVEALRQLAWLEGRAFEVLGEEWRPTIRNHRGLAVGRIEPCLSFAFEAGR